MSRAISRARTTALDSAAALELWVDSDRRPSFIEGFARLVRRDDAWPADGARLVWESSSGGRGPVGEKVLEHSATTFVADVLDKRLIGTQRAEFTLVPGGGSQALLTLDYDLPTEHPFANLYDLLYLRRQVAAHLERTLARFAIEADEEALLRADAARGGLR